MDEILSPHISELICLLRDPDGAVENGLYVPALAWLERQNGQTHGLVPLAGCLSTYERAQISNWFKERVAKDMEGVHEKDWIGSPVLAHAMTLYLASVSFPSQMKATNDPEHQVEEDMERKQRMEEAWDMVTRVDARAAWRDVDVDKEALYNLEELMFENSMAAGMAGNEQWGLNVGDHQEGWNPYMGLPDGWNVGDRVGSDSETKVVSAWEIVMHKTTSNDLFTPNR